MPFIENRLPYQQEQDVFALQYTSDNVVVVGTSLCPTDRFGEMVSLFDNQGEDCFYTLSTYTARGMYVVNLEASNSPYTIICKKSRFDSNADNSIVSPVEEILANRKLSSIIQTLDKQQAIPQPNTARKSIVRTELPLGFFVNKKSGSSYTVFQYETGYEPGEALNFVDPPISGASNYDLHLWQVRYDIQAVTDTLLEKAHEEGLAIHDFGVHQALYHLDTEQTLLDIVIIDSEQNHITK